MRKIAVVIAVIGLAMSGYISTLAQNDNCPANYEGFLTPRLQVGQRGIVVPGGSGNRVRNNPDPNADQVGTMPPGTEFEVTDGPQCAASIVWWRVLTDDNLQGWTAEGLLPDDYFLELVITDRPTAAHTLTPSPYPTRPPSPTPTAVHLPALDLPNRTVLSPENLDQMEIIGEIPATGRAISLFASPDMAYLFIVSVGEFQSKHTNVYTFPNLEPVTQGLPLEDISYKAVGGGEPDGLFADDGRVLIAINFNNEDILFYRPGDNSFALETVSFRYLRVAALNAEGILAVGFSILREGNPPMLCFIDKFGDTYAPDDRLCPPLESGVSEVSFLPDGQRLLTGSVNGLTLYDVRSGEMLQTFDYTVEVGGAMALLPGTGDENNLPTVFISQEGFVLSVNLETGEQRTYPSGAGQLARKISFNNDGTQMMLIVPTTNVPDVLVVDVATKAILHQNSLFGGESAAYSPDNNLAFINNAIYDTESWEMLTKLRGDQHIIRFSPDGTLLFVSNSTKGAFEIYGVPDS